MSDKVAIPPAAAPGKSVMALCLVLFPILWLNVGWIVVQAKELNEENVVARKEHFANASVDYALGVNYDLKVSSYRIFPQRKYQQGGGLELVDNDTVIFATGDGEFYLIHIDASGLELEPIKVKSPIERNKHKYHRVTDILFERRDGLNDLLYTAATNWDKERNCYTLGVFETNINLSNKTAGNWTLRYQTDPCQIYMGNQQGGRLALTSNKSILLSTGIGFGPLENLNDHPYGKVLELDPASWRMSVFSSGHRNPQGLLIDGDEVWETEHGPHGGDELNLLTHGKDYGWPNESYGTDYDRKMTLSLDNASRQNLQTAKPIFAWTPSIGVSNLIRIHGGAFPTWKGDLLVSSLAGQSLFRVRIWEGRAVVVEPLRTGQRIRDLIELPDGRLVLWNGSNKIQIIEQANQAFSACAGCHPLRDAVNDGIGPDLMGVVGRKVAGQKGYEYSAAMMAFGGQWTPARLDAFLKDPQAIVPGTTMEFGGIADPDVRKETIQYLQSVKPERR